MLLKVTLFIALTLSIIVPMVQSNSTHGKSHH